MSDLLPDDLPAGKRRVFAAILVVSVLSLAAYIFDVYISDAVAEGAISGGLVKHVVIIKSILENLIAGAIAAIFLALSYRTVVNWVDPADRVLEISPGRITSRLISNARSAKNYIFVGNTATFVSASILPVIVDSARVKGQMRHVDLFLINPLEQSVIESYASFKSAVAVSKSKISDHNMAKWVLPSLDVKAESIEDVKGKILAAIYLTAFASTAAGVTACIYLRREFTPFRVDLSDREVVLTQESAAEAAVAFSARGHFYDWYRKDAETLKGQSLVLNFSVDRVELLSIKMAHPSSAKSDVIAALKRLLLIYPALQSLNENVINIAAARIVRPSHSYGG